MSFFLGDLLGGLMPLVIDAPDLPFRPCTQCGEAHAPVRPRPFNHLCPDCTSGALHRIRPDWILEWDFSRVPSPEELDVMLGPDPERLPGISFVE